MKMSVGGNLPKGIDPMKGFKDTTKTLTGFDFSRTSTPVKMHQRTMPQKKMADAAPVKKAEGGANWIAGATENKGALHRALDVPAGEKIPAKKLTKAAHSKSPLMRKRATLAKTLGAMHKAKGGAVRHHDEPMVKSRC